MRARPRIAALWRRSRFEREVDEELRFHLEMEEEKNVALGMSPDEARETAARSFGGISRVKEDIREMNGLAFIDSLAQDAAFALRGFRQSPGFTLLVVVTLALGIGANTAIFSAIHGVMLSPLPFAHGERLYVLRQTAPQEGFDEVAFSVAEVEDYRAAASLESVVEYHDMPFFLLGEGEPERVRTGVVSHDFFDVLGIGPVLGRGFEPGDGAPDAEPVLLIAHEYWQRRFSGDPGVLGRELEMNDRAHRVVGVLPPLPPFPDRNDVFMTTSACPFRMNPGFVSSRTARMMSVLARRAASTSEEEMQAELDAIASRLSRIEPEVYSEEHGYAVDATSMRDELTARARPTFLTLLAAAGFVLMIACANVANVMLSRLLHRRRELDLRSAVGAGRGRLLRQLLTECTILSIAGGALGLGLAWAGLDFLVSFASRFTPRAAEIEMSGGVLAFTLVLSIATGLGFGTIPSLSTGARRASTRAGALRGALVVTQVAVSLVLLSGAGLMLRSVMRLHRVDAGFDPDRVLTVLLDLNWSRYSSSEAIRAFHEELLDRVGRHPGVTSAAIGRTFPLNPDVVPLTRRVRANGASGGSDWVDLHCVTPDYFRTIGAPLVEGRSFDTGDGAASKRVAIVNRAAAESWWPEGSPVARRISGDDGVPFTIVGVVGNVRQRGLARDAEPAVYVPMAQLPVRQSNLVVRTASRPETMGRSLAEIVYAIDPQQAVANVETLAHVREDSLAPPVLTATLLGIFAALALLITATGVGGVLALSIGQRRRELGLRMALGASPRKLADMVLRQGLSLVACGVGVGLVASLLATGSMSDLLFEIEPTDPGTLLAGVGVLLAVAGAACWTAARRTTTIDPMSALRVE